MEYKDLVALARAGQIDASDFVRSNWHQDWQPASLVLDPNSFGDREPSSTEWSETVDAAMQAARARNRSNVPAEASEPAWSFPKPLSDLGAVVTSVAGFLFRPLRGAGHVLFAGRTAEVCLAVAALIPALLPALFAIACAAIVGGRVEEWSRLQALDASVRGHSSGMAAVSADAVVEVRRSLPFVGELSVEGYLFGLFDMMLVVGAAAWFLVRSLLAVYSNARDWRLVAIRTIMMCLLPVLVISACRNSPLATSADERVLVAIRSAVSQIEATASGKGSQDDWDACEARVLAETRSSVAVLAGRVGEGQNSAQEAQMDQYIRKPLIQIARYDLPALIQVGRRQKPVRSSLDRIQRSLNDISRHMDTMRLFRAPGSATSRSDA